MAQFPTLDNAAGVWKLQDVYNNVMDGTWPNIGAVGIFGGGVKFPATNTASTESFNLTSGGEVSVFGNLSTARRALGSTSSLSRGLFAGGYTPTNTNVIQYVTIASTGNAEDFGDLTEVKARLSATSNSITGIFGGGNNPSLSNIIDFATIASAGNAADFGDLIAPNDGLAACSDGHGGLQ